MYSTVIPPRVPPTPRARTPLVAARFLSPKFCPPTLFNHRLFALILCDFPMVLLLLVQLFINNISCGSK